MKNKQHKELAVCGFEAVRALAQHNPEQIQRLFFTQERASYFGAVCKKLAEQRKIYRCVESQADLERLSQSVHHQGVVAMIEAPTTLILDLQQLRTWQAKHERVLVLDRVGNANNLGAIVRSAAFFGIKNIVISAEDTQAQITTSSYRVAEGGMEFVAIWQAPSATWLVKESKGLLQRIGADHRACTSLSELPQKISKDQGFLLFMGNEEFGLSEEVKNSCDLLVKIPGSGALESLNVAQAASLFLYAISILGTSKN